MTTPLINALTQAAAFYREQLRASSVAVDYLKARGLSGTTAARYGVGYAPSDFQGLRQGFSDYADHALEKAGLVAVNDAGRRYDRFRDRIMFPIVNEVGDVIGFGGRLLKGDGPKYLNSPETEVFQKGSVLFGLYQAMPTITTSQTVFVVEGYMDVISLAQHGVENAVATLGTATTSQHVAQLLTIAKQVVFCFDGDAAGRRAAAHALDVCLPHVTDETDIRFLFLPNEHDPDSYVRTEGGAAFNRRAQDALPLEKFFMTNAAQGCQLEYAEGRVQLVSGACNGLRRIKAPALLHRLLGHIAQLSRFTVDELTNLCSLRLC